MALYIIDREDGVLASKYVALDPKGKVFLLQDGLYLSPEIFKDKEVYVLADEVTERGLEARLPESYKRTTYSEIVDLLMENSVISFC